MSTTSHDAPVAPAVGAVAGRQARPVTFRRVPWHASHRMRVTVTFAVAAALVSAVVAALAYTSSGAYLRDQREAAGRDRAYLNARLVRDQLRGGAEPGAALAELAPEEAATSLVRVGETWYSSSVGVDGDDLPLGVLAEVEGGVAAWQRYTVRGTAQLVVAVPIPSAGALYAEVIPLRQLEEALSTMRSSLLAAGAVTTGAGAVLGFLAAGRLVRPLRRLAARAEAIASGAEVELEPVSEADLQPLVTSLNRVIERYASRVEERTRFTSEVSHEIRGPLAALSAGIEVMQRRRDQLPARSAGALDVLADQVAGFQQLVVDLLEISQIDGGRAHLEVEPTRCSSLARAAVTAAGASARVVVDPDVPDVVLVDRRRLGQILTNLIDNAARYAGGATEIHVARRGDAIRFAVRDRGPGVPVEERTRIFGRFERGTTGLAGPSGTGLGLALVAEQAALHGGRAFVEDAAGGGAEFVVEVPLCEPAF